MTPDGHGPISRDTAPHYAWGNGCDGWHLVRTPALSVIEEQMPPGSAEVRHRHRHARQFFRVLTGALRVEVDGITHDLHAPQGLEVAPGLPHEVRNDGTVPAVFLVISQPASHGDREAVPAAGAPT
jgi:mannose-6-phosphate isomerase-like protein (cupin superfamily)